MPYYHSMHLALPSVFAYTNVNIATQYHSLMNSYFQRNIETQSLKGSELSCCHLLSKPTKLFLRYAFQMGTSKRDENMGLFTHMCVTVVFRRAFPEKA